MKASNSALSFLCLMAANMAVNGFTSPQTTQAKISPLQSTVDAVSNTIPNILADFSHETSERLPYSPVGYSTWSWDTHHNPTTQMDANSKERTTHKINYLTLGPVDAPAIVLVHGFGASSYHWRHPFHLYR